jgi:hypothetical protein
MKVPRSLEIIDDNIIDDRIIDDRIIDDKYHIGPKIS